MFKKKETTQENASESENSSESREEVLIGQPISNYLTRLYIILTIILTSAWLFSYVLSDLKLKSHEKDRTQAIMEVTAERITEQLNLRKKKLRLLAKDPTVANLLEAEDQEALGTHIEWTLMPEIEDAINIRVLPVEWNKPDPKQNPPFGFAALDLLRQVEQTNKETLFEIHHPNTKRAHISIAMPITNSAGKLLGSIYFALKADWLQKTIAQVPQTTAVALIQKLPNEPIKVETNVSGFDFSDSLHKAKSATGSIWLVAAKGNSSGMGWMDYAYWLLLPLIIAVGAEALIITRRQLDNEIARDQQDLHLIVAALFNGRRPPISRARLQEMHRNTQIILKTAKNAAVSIRNNMAGTPAPQQESIAPPPAREPQAPQEQSPAKEEQPEVTSPVKPEPAIANISPSIFRAYDIRGVVGKTLTESVVYDIGKAIGSEAYEKGQQTVIIARDGRNSGAVFADALTRGLTSTGRDVVDIGQAPTPLLYFATHFLGSNSGVMITGSHNPPEYNGLKVVINGIGLHGEAIQSLYERAVDGRFLIGDGSRTEQSLIADYIRRVADNITLHRTLKVVVDCGNGVAGAVAPELLRDLGCEVIELYSDVDGNFPNHHPDPTRPENLTDLINSVKKEQADLGIGFDGDGDRLGVVDNNGHIIWADRILMMLAEDILIRNPGADIVYDVKSTRHLAPKILSMGGRPVMWKTGHSLMKAKMRESGALLGGEMSGHIFIKERWYGFDDALYAAARLLEILAADPRTSAEVFADLPEDVSTPEIHLEIPEGSQQEIMEKIISSSNFEKANIITIDGLRVEFSKGWGLVRPSNTTPVLVFRFEAETAEDLNEIQQKFRDLLQTAVPDLQAPF